MGAGVPPPPPPPPPPAQRPLPLCGLPPCPFLPPLRNLRKLDISDLPAVSNPGLTQILVEEMLPDCKVVGADWARGLKVGQEEQYQDITSPIPA